MLGESGDFQKATLDKITAMFKNNSASPPEFVEKEFENKGFYETFLLSKIFYRGEEIGIYLYEDGAQFSGDKVDRRYEKYDYDSLTDLGETFVKTLEDYLFYPERYTPNRTVFMIFGDFLRSVFKGRT